MDVAPNSKLVGLIEAQAKFRAKVTLEFLSFIPAIVNLVLTRASGLTLFAPWTFSPRFTIKVLSDSMQ